MDFRNPRIHLETEQGKGSSELLKIPGENKRRQSVDVNHNFTIPRNTLGNKVLIQSIDSPEESPRINQAMFRHVNVGALLYEDDENLVSIDETESSNT